MSTRAGDLLRQGRSEELWEMCCGFLNLNIEQFMDIQKRLLLEQISLLNNGLLGDKIMRGVRPENIDEFRALVPLTSYASYCPELLEKHEKVLPSKPAFWIRTSGKSGEYPCKWVPITPGYAREMSSIMYGIGILSSCNGWHDTSGMNTCPRIVYTVAPRPYTSGAMAAMLEQQTDIAYLPPIGESENMDFEQRVKAGFKHALSGGLDFFFGLSMVLVAVGNKFSQPTENINIRPLLQEPKALLRLARGVVKSKLARRPLLPRDIWSVRGIITSGLDSGVYRDKIKDLWGKYPLDVYSGTEGGIIATQTWDYSGMTFIPTLNFLEFVPEKEYFKWQADHNYQPRTVLMNEVKAGENYEIVLTNFHGGALVRYRPGDMVRITSLSNDNLGINLPQMAFVGRADNLLDFGVTRLTEKIIWQAIENSGIPYEDWVARKEITDRMTLRVFIELKDGATSTETEVADAIEEQLKRLDSSFVATHSDVGSYLDFSPKVTFLPRGAFTSYISQRRAEGAEIAHLKPPHINPSEKVLELLRAPAVVKVSSEQPGVAVP